MASPWGKPRNWDLDSQNLIHRGTGISSFVGKGSGLRTTEKKKAGTFGPADWRKSSSSLPSSHYGTLPRKNTTSPARRTSVMSPGTRAILARSNSKSDNSSKDIYFSFNDMSYENYFGSQNSRLTRSKSSTFFSQQNFSQPGLFKSSSTTFTPPGLKKCRATSLTSIDHNSRLRKSHSTATLPRGTKLIRDESESLTVRSGYGSRKSLPIVLKRSSSNELSSRTRTRDSIDELSEATIRSKQTREKHRQRPENILQIRKNPPVSIKNMNVRGNQVVRSSSYSAKPSVASRNVTRSKSMSAVRSPYQGKTSRHSNQANSSNSESESRNSMRKKLSYIKNTNYQSPYTQNKTRIAIQKLSESDSCSEGFSQKFSQVKKSRKNFKRRDFIGDIKPKVKVGKENLGMSQYGRMKTRRGREPYIYHNISNKFKVDSEDGVDDTLFDCTPISSESEVDVMKPELERQKLVADKPSFRELRDIIRLRCSREIRFPRARSMSPGRRKCLKELHQISFNLERPPTSRELADYYRDPAMIPKFQNQLQSHRNLSKIAAQRSRRTRNKYANSMRYQDDRHHSFSSTDESSVISFSEYERRLIVDHSTASDTDIHMRNTGHELKEPEKVSYSTTFKQKATISNESDSTNELESSKKTDPTLSDGLTTHASREYASININHTDSQGDDSAVKTNDGVDESNKTLNEDDVIAELQNLIEQEEMDIDSTSSSVLSFNPQIPENSSKENDKSVIDGSHEKLLSDNEINSEIKLLTESLSDTVHNDTRKVLQYQPALELINDSYNLDGETCTIENSSSLNRTSDKRDHSDDSSNFDQFKNICSQINLQPDEKSQSELSSDLSSDNSASSADDNFAETLSRPSFSRPGSPLGFIRPIRTSFSANTLAYLQNKKLDDVSETTGINMKIVSIINRSRPSSPSSFDEVYSSKTESDELCDTIKPNTKSLSFPDDTNRNITLTDLSPDYNVEPLKASPEVVDTSSLLPDQRPYYKTVVVDPLSPATGDLIAGEELSSLSSQNVSDSFTESLKL
ncbi:hypothetical protein ACHWQZ_G008230 [Mnemiopsis leidyi]